MKKDNLKTLTVKEKKAVLEFKDRMNQNFSDKIRLIELFGSKARGDSGKESDIDLLVVTTEKNLKLRDMIYDVVIDVDLKYNVYLSLKVFPSREFNRLQKLDTPFMQNIKKEAIVIWQQEQKNNEKK